MSKLLEKIFKEKLQDYDAGLSNDAWRSFEKKLDTGNGFSNNLKYVLWSVAIVAILVPLMYFSLQTPDSKNQYFSENNSQNFTDVSEETNSLEEKIISDNAKRLPDAYESENSESSEVTLKTNEPRQLLGKSDNEYEYQEDVADMNQSAPNEKTTEKLSHASPAYEKQMFSKEDKKEVQKTFVPGVVTKDFLCKGETTKVKNTSSSENELVRLDVDGVVIDLQPGKELELNLASSSQILFLNKKNEVIDSKQIEVLKSDLPVPNVVANVFDEGLPVAEVNLIGTFKSANWYFDNRMIGEGAQQSIHTFYKGNHFVYVRGTDENGCAFNLEIPIHVENDYNLMAPNSLSPEGGDVRRRTFIPFALKQRETPFTMFIIDPRDNDVIYTTRDVNSPWDGVDRRTGKLVSKERSFVWKVQLESPEKGEKNIYIGNVIHF
ncbi:MAG: hypothetical protein JJT77_00370 [Crocinitomicaceae bacterium]|nr:hypothetical protein [Crocinitomicaceae bacterium]